MNDTQLYVMIDRRFFDCGTCLGRLGDKWLRQSADDRALGEIIVLADAASHRIFATLN